MLPALGCRQTPEGVILPVHVVPGASRERIAGLHNGRVRVAVAAPPEKGKANKALVALLATALGVRKSQISVVRGETGREKDVLIASGQVKNILSKLEPYLR